MRSTAMHKTLLATVAALLVIGAGTVATSQAGLHVEMTYSSEPVDVRVWLDRGYDQYYGDADIEDVGTYYDVYPSVDDVVLYVRAARNCYATVYVIDTEGFIHVVHPFSPYDDGFLVGGRMYRLWLRDYDFHRGCFGRGVSFAFAVSSPVPFAYASYGPAVFGPCIGYQICGDPFVASRLFYLSILTPACHRGLVSVSYARFYVTEYVRYPSYLCLGWCDPRGYGSCDGRGCGAYRDYRIHAKDPYRVLRPAVNVVEENAQYTRITPTGVKDATDVRVSKAVQPRMKDAGEARTSKTLQPRVRDANDARAERERRIVAARTPAERTEAAVRSNVRLVGARATDLREPSAATRVVKSTKESYVTSKRNYEKAREQYERSANKDGAEIRPAAKNAPAGDSNTRATRITRRAVKEAREPVALGDASPKQKPKAGKSTKRTE